jgi:hypothetical protein
MERTAKLTNSKVILIIRLIDVLELPAKNNPEGFALWHA